MEKLLFSSFQNIETYRHLRDTLLRYHSLILEPPPISFLALLARTLSDDSFFPVFLFDTERDSEKALEACLAFFPENTVAWLPFYEYGTDLFNKARFENHFARYASLQVQKQLSCLITSPALLNHLVQNPTRTQKSVLTISTGQTFSFTWFQLHLSDIGYERVDLVEHPGEFCIRGGIIDVYPFGSALPFRLEFFGDTINSLRTFNPDSQLSLENQTHLLLFPSSSYSPYTPFLSHLPDKTIFITSSSLSLPENSSFYSLVLSESPKALSFSVLVPPPLRSDFPRKTHILKVAKSYKQLYVFWQSPLLKDQLNEIFHSLTQTTVLFVQGSLPESFVIRDLQTAFVNDTYFFCKEYLFNPDAPFIPNVERITKRDVLKYGDAVVHVDYGIGIYLGTRYADGDEQVILEYDQGDRVYLPVRHLDKIYQFSEGHIEHIHPDSLKRKTWEPKKQRAKKAVIQITDDLLRLYKKRATKKGIAMEGDHVSEKELALSFPWTETHDQELAIKTVKDDLAKPIIMDRLICGDVGFGKTEVALRSAYRAVISGYQVAVLVPTTILSIQHYETFKERLSPLGVSIDILNRFRSDREFKNLCESVVQGKIDILIGTHRLLSKKLFFKNLGLLIIDEEHRFGVHHKERIQHIKSTIDVLSMSATPIPRTLQLSLSGIRDITRIDTPPKERIPIYTKIIHWDSSLIQQILREELQRRGQVFVVDNNIQELPALTQNLQSLVPEARIQFAHGQLSGKTLEKLLIDFLHHHYDILVSTTIIESGIDIPNANTLIIMNAHRFGLSQLYQIRGRVGRSFRKAYAYFVIPQNIYINLEAMQRLKALEYYTDLGSGYHIAMRDLELRGAGNLLGIEQSGHIDHIGTRYFLKLLSDEIKKRTAETSPLDTYPEISLDIPAFLPETYIPSSTVRLDLYQSIAAANEPTDILPLFQELTDRFGTPPPEAVNLLKLRELYVLARHTGIESIIQEKKSVCLFFNSNIPNEILQNLALIIVSTLKNAEIPHTFYTKGNFSLRLSLDKRKVLETLKMLLESLLNKNKFKF